MCPVCFFVCAEALGPLSERAVPVLTLGPRGCPVPPSCHGFTEARDPAPGGHGLPCKGRTCPSAHTGTEGVPRRGTLRPRGRPLPVLPPLCKGNCPSAHTGAEGLSRSPVLSWLHRGEGSRPRRPWPPLQGEVSPTPSSVTEGSSRRPVPQRLPCLKGAVTGACDGDWGIPSFARSRVFAAVCVPFPLFSASLLRFFPAFVTIRQSRGKEHIP